MSAPFVVSADARERQRRAADPGASVWVSANAGSGKTKVLTDRLLRLLLAGTAPAKILCLTFTKAAAAEMTVRAFAQLGDWVTLDDRSLSEAIADLTGERATPALRARARRLFARAVETPGGLKIETIHAFCERILHLVPFEANVPAGFTVLDETQAGQLAAEARGRVLADAARREPRFAALTAALSVVAADAADVTVTTLLDEAAADERVPGTAVARTAAMARLRTALRLGAGETSDDIRRDVLAGLDPEERSDLEAALLATGKPRDRERAAALAGAAGPGSLPRRAESHLSAFFTGDGKPRADSDLATKGVDPGVRARLAAEAERLVPIRDRLLSSLAAERTEALFVLAGAAREMLADAKRRLGALDFADLIRATVDLLDSAAAPWVQYKLDRGVDHVLVDEAQDTSPAQWRILRKLTDEFTAGHGRPHRRPRTVFAVGDPKQSIFSFQGADPEWFDQSRRYWHARTQAANGRFDHVRLDLSFRSAPAVLRAVDDTFAVAGHVRGLAFGEAVGTVHETARPAAPGIVELWEPALPAVDRAEPDAWSVPVDLPDPRSPALAAAERVARAVRAWTREGDEDGRVWHPGEILILARKRGPAFFAVIRELKTLGVPVAGADRLDVGEHMAVNDLVAAGRAALLPGDDLVLAAALKSPLVGLDDDDLLRLAADRPDGQSLADALAGQETCDPAAARGASALRGWRDLARRHGPFGFFAALLGPGDGRRRLVERLGGEAADAIDTFLSDASAAEDGTDAPSLTAFLSRFDGTPHTIRRDLDRAGREVRVMTVHGAKGLEAPVVVVLDGCDVYGPDPKLLPVPIEGADPVPVWALGRENDSGALAAARAAAKTRALAEHNRLLYVAMTRARDRLVIAPFVPTRKDAPPESWCSMIRAGFAAAGRTLVRRDAPDGWVDAWRSGPDAWEEPDRPVRTQPVADEPGWLRLPVSPEGGGAPPLRPSGVAGSSTATSAEFRRRARQRGTLVHGLIEQLAGLAAEEVEQAAGALAAQRASGLDEAGRSDAVAAALRVLRHPDLRPLFGPGSRAEVAIAGRLAGADGASREISGQIDRIAVRPDEVLAADFKTGRPPAGGSVPAAYLAQLALYRALLAAIHPSKAVRTLLVWTDGPEIVEPDDAALDAALARALA